MEGGQEKNLPFMAVGRLQDEITLASYPATGASSEQETDAASPSVVFGKLLKAAKKKLRKGEKTRLQWNDGSVCCILDMKGELLYCVVTTELSYPEKLAYGCLRDLEKQVAVLDTTGDLTASQQAEMVAWMKEICNRYEDREQWEDLEKAMNVVSHTGDKMAANAAGLQKTTQAASAMGKNAQMMHENSTLFVEKGADLDQTYKNRNMRFVCLIGIVVLLLVFIGAAMLMRSAAPDDAKPAQDPAAAAELVEAVSTRLLAGDEDPHPSLRQ